MPPAMRPSTKRRKAGGLALAGAALLAGCATAPPDPVCAAIRDFANATPPGTTHAVEMTTRRFTDGRFGASTECADGGYGPGRPLCKALVEHSSREFPVGNVKHVLACIHADRRFDLPVANVRSLSGEIVSYEMPGVDEAVTLTLVFAAVQETGSQAPPLLRLVARRAPAGR